MTINFKNSLGEGQFTNRPPIFNDTNYWKNRMRIYIQSVNYELWRIIVKAPKTPTKRVEYAIVPKHNP